MRFKKSAANKLPAKRNIPMPMKGLTNKQAVYLLNSISWNNGNFYLLILGIQAILTAGWSLIDAVHLIVETGSLHMSSKFLLEILDLYTYIPSQS